MKAETIIEKLVENKAQQDNQICLNAYAKGVADALESLQGIETNNGWIKIESEDDLPKDNLVEYYFYDFKVHERMKVLFVDIKPVTLTALVSLYRIGLCTHYQPIEKPKPPLY